MPLRPASASRSAKGCSYRDGSGAAWTGLSLERIPDSSYAGKRELDAVILTVINGYLGDRDLSLRQVTIVDATLIDASSSTKNKR